MKYEVGTFVHVCGRGTRKLPIVHDDRDRWHFLECLYYLNHTQARRNLFRQLQEYRKEERIRAPFLWPAAWEKRNPLVNVVNYALVENHYHLLLQERTEGGISRFMQKFGTSMAKYYNTKHGTSGNLFAGRYRAKVVATDEYLMYVSVYIQVKNVLELYPGGLRRALQHIEKAFEWAAAYPFGSLGDYVKVDQRRSPILEQSVLGEMFVGPKAYRRFAKECFEGMNLAEKLGPLTLE